MNKSIEKELAKLQLKLNCGKVLFTTISVLLSLLVAPVMALLYFVIVVFTLMVMTTVCIGLCVYLPFATLYVCLKNKCEFNLEESIEGEE